MIQSVCVFGDSVAKGVVFDAIKNKYVLLRDCFANTLQNIGRFTIKNYARFGATIHKGAEILQKHREELPKYDYIALEFGGNDCDFDWSEVADAPNSDHQPKTPVPKFEACYAAMVREIKKSGGNPVVLSLPPIDAQRYFKWISRGLDADNILHWLGDVEHIYRWHEMYNLAVCRVAKEEQIPLLDISSAFLETAHYQDLICEDGIHPNEKGHQLITSVLEVYIKSVAAA